MDFKVNDKYNKDYLLYKQILGVKNGNSNSKETRYY